VTNHTIRTGVRLTIQCPDTKAARPADLVASGRCPSARSIFQHQGLKWD